MGAKSVVIHEGVREVHAQAASEDYATLCGMDGADDHRHVQQVMGTWKRGEKIDCPQCKQIIMHARNYKPSELA